MNDIFKLIERHYSLRIQFRPEDPNGKIWYRNRKLWHGILFQINAKLSCSWQKEKLRFQKTVLNAMQNI